MEMKKILRNDGYDEFVKPPRMTALQELHEAETGVHLVFLLELYFLQEPKMKLQQNSQSIVLKVQKFKRTCKCKDKRCRENNKINWFLSC